MKLTNKPRNTFLTLLIFEILCILFDSAEKMVAIQWTSSFWFPSRIAVKAEYARAPRRGGVGIFALDPEEKKLIYYKN